MPLDNMRETMAAAMPALYGYTYRAVSDADLAEYLAFNRSPLVTRYNDAVMDAFTEALTRTSVGVGPPDRERPAEQSGLSLSPRLFFAPILVARRGGRP